MSAAPTLRKYQHDSLEAVAKAYTDGMNRVLLKKPTGTGKTVTFAAMLKFLEQRFEVFLPNGRSPRYSGKGARMLVIAHREELLDQAADKIRRQNPGLIVDIEQGERYASRVSDVVIASIQTLAAGKFRRLLNLLRSHTFRLVIIDEAHHAAAPTYRTALVHLGFLPPADISETTEVEAANFDDVERMKQALEGWDLVAPKDRLLVGVTATPNRSDAIGLGCVFQTIAYSYALKAAIEDGFLVPIKPWVVETDTSLDDVRITHGEFNQKDLADTVNTERRNKLAVAAWREYAENLPTIAFTVNVAHAHALALEFEDAGYRARAVSGETPKDERRATLEAFSAGNLDVVTNCMVLTEGTDLPITRCILHAKPTKSATLYEQMTGRGLRLFEGKPECIVIDLVDVARRHSLQAAPVLYGLPPGIKTKGEDLKHIADELEALAAKYDNKFDVDAALKQGPLSLKELLAKASTFDIWKVPELGIYRETTTLDWIRAGTEDAPTFRLQYPWQDGTEVLSVEPDVLGHYDLVATVRPAPDARGMQAQVRQRTIATQLPNAGEALKLAETFIFNDRRSVQRLKSRNAPWKQAPATPPQLGALQRLRIPHNPKTITKGEASGLLDIYAARRGR